MKKKILPVLGLILMIILGIVFIPYKNAVSWPQTLKDGMFIVRYSGQMDFWISDSEKAIFRITGTDYPEKDLAEDVWKQNYFIVYGSIELGEDGLEYINSRDWDIIDVDGIQRTNNGLINDKNNLRFYDLKPVDYIVSPKK